MTVVWDDAHRAALAERAEFWMDRGVIVLPVIPTVLPAERWPARNRRTGEPMRDKAGNLVPGFRGRLPSYWTTDGEPRMLQWKALCAGTKKPPTKGEVLGWLKPVQKGAAAEFGSPIGIAILANDTTVVIDLDEPEHNDKLLQLVGDQALVEASPSGGLHVIVEPADQMASWCTAKGGRFKVWGFSDQEGSVGEVLAAGSVCVMAPTQRGEGSAYRVIQGDVPMVVDSLAAVGVHPKASAAQKALNPSDDLDPAPHPELVTTGGGSGKFIKNLPDPVVPTLRALLGQKARGLLDGDLTAYTKDGVEAVDRSGTLAAFIREAYGCENLLRANAKPFIGTAEELIEEAIEILGNLDGENEEPIADKAERILATIDRSTCDADPENLLKRHSFHSSQPSASEGPSIFQQRYDWLRDKAPFNVVGYDESSLYILPQVSGLVQQIKLEKIRHESQLCLLTPRGAYDWFLSPFRYESKKGPQIDWAAAGDMLAGSRQILSIYEPEMIRGRGCWLDGDHVVIHLGNELVVDGQKVAINDFSASRFVYAKSRDLPGPSDAALSDAEANALVGAVSRFNWEKPADPFHLLGWIVSGLICGALEWRPNGWLTGPSGSGKTTVLESFVEPLLAGMALRTSASGSEAGIRQVLKHDALPVIFDELESESRADIERIKKILQLMRGSSSPGGAQVVKGTASGVAQTYVIRSNFLLASINVGLRNEADINRTCIMTLLPLTQDHIDAKDEFDSELSTITEETGRRLLARVLRQMPIILKNAEIFKRACAQHRGTARAGDVYGTLAACALVFYPEGKRVLTVPEAVELLQRLAPLSLEELPPTEGRTYHDSDAEDCLEHLLTCTLRVNRTLEGKDINETNRVQVTELSVRTALEAAFGHHDGFDLVDIEIRLRERGLKLVNTEVAGPALAVSEKHPGLAGWFGETRWASNAWGRALKRHSSCIPGDVRFNPGRSSRVEKRVPRFPVSEIIDPPNLPPYKSSPAASAGFNFLSASDFEKNPSVHLADVFSPGELEDIDRATAELAADELLEIAL